MKAIHVNENDFNDVVLQDDAPVLVDFWAPWCGPCRAMSDIVDDVADEVAGRATVVKANVDETAATAARYGVQSIPAFVVLRNGEVQDQFSGVVPRERLLAALQPHLN